MAWRDWMDSMMRRPPFHPDKTLPRLGGSGRSVSGTGSHFFPLPVAAWSTSSSLG